MEILSPTDVILFKTGILGASAYVLSSFVTLYTNTKHIQPDLPLLAITKNARPPAVQPTRSVLKQLDQADRHCMVFYGSQTGTAERFAHKFAREALQRFNLRCIVGDLDDYDFGDLCKLSRNHVVVFILATYGEGEPTDNAMAFLNFIKNDATQLGNLHFGAFGLGSSSYTHFNAMVQRVDELLVSRNARRLGSVGMGDDGRGALEEDFSLWTDSTLPMIASHFSLEEVPYIYKPAFSVIEKPPPEIKASVSIFHGEPNKAHLQGCIQGPFTAQNPFPARVICSRELFASPNRSCLELAFDVSGTSVSYDTGDHLALWPINSNLQVEMFLKVFSLSAKKGYIINVDSVDPSNSSPVPVPTTYEVAVRHYLDICTVVTRQMLQKLLDFTVSDAIRFRLLQLAEKKSRFITEVTAKQLTISQLLHGISAETGTVAAIDAPFSLILELMPRLRPRHYSISSSSLVARKSISITAVIDSKENPTQGVSFKGVSTGYLSALNNARKDATELSHILQDAGKPGDEVRPLIHVRRSKFRPPFDPSTPIVMIGPGTGVAPFRAFVQERVYQYAQGRNIGRTILFYGCRDSAQDYLYREEWEYLKQEDRLGNGKFDIYTAFSREPGRPRQYVQDLIMEDQRAGEIQDLVHTKRAVIYICGNAARMAKDVTKAMGQVLTNTAGVPDIVTQLKKEGRWYEDVW